MMTQPLIVVPVATDSMMAPNSMITASCPYKSHISQPSVTDPMGHPQESKCTAAKVKLYMSLAHTIQISVLNPLWDVQKKAYTQQTQLSSAYL